MSEVTRSNTMKARCPTRRAPLKQGYNQASLHLFREEVITDKSGGHRWEASDVERMLAYKPDRKEGELESIESNGWCRPHIKTNLPARKVKGSVMVQVSQARAVMQVESCRVSGVTAGCQVT